MPMVKKHGNQLTLPDELREALSSASDDELEAEVVEEGVLVRSSASTRRKVALDRIHKAQASVRLSRELSSLSPEQRDAMIVEEVKAYRRERRQQDDHE